MSSKSILILLVISSFLVALSLSGCGSVTQKIGWRENSSLSHTSARYATYNGNKEIKICIVSKKTVSMEYKVTVDKGTLTVGLDRPDGTSYWQNTFSQNASGTLSVPDADKGCYTLLVAGEETGGGFDIAWTITH